MKKYFIYIIAALLILPFISCQKQEEKQAAQPKAKITGPIIADPSTPPKIEPQDFNVIVPDLIKESWSDVVLTFKDKEKGEEKEFKVKIGEKLEVPDTDLVIKVGPFLPDLTIIGGTITSASNEPNNPSVGIVIYEKGYQVFPQSGKEWGWLYAKLPSMHAFEHDRYGLTLKEGVKSGTE
jgi:hypothetical protein